MKRNIFFMILVMIVILTSQTYSQDSGRGGALCISTGPAPTETIKATTKFLIKDPAKHRTGFDISSGTFLNEIPNTGCDDEGIGDDVTGDLAPEIWVCYLLHTPIDGVYKVSIIGTGSGEYYLDIFAYDINKDLIFAEKDLGGTTYPGKIDNYEIIYSSAPGSQVKVTYTGSSEIPVFDGKGQRPTDVDKFLQYFNPTQARTELPSGTQNFNLSIIYGNTIKRETFSAELNGTDITKNFAPLTGKMEIVKIPLTQGSNNLVLSIKGVRTDGKIAEDKDRLVFIVP